MTDILEKILEDKYPAYAKLPIVDDINADENPRDDFWSDLSEKESYDINAEFLRQTGDPKYDYLTCWEPGRIDDENETLFDFPTFYEFDLAWWKFQKEAQYESVEDCKKWMEQGSDHWTPERVAKAINDLEERYENGYEIYCSGDWFRLIENDIFIYGQVVSAKWYLYFHLEGFIGDLQDSLIPYSLNEKDHDFQTLLNLDDPEEKYCAEGREIELNTLQDAVRKYEGEPLLEAIGMVMGKYNHSGGTFRYDRKYTQDDFDPFTDYIFWDEQSLKNVRTTHFVEDFKDNLKDASIIDKMIVEIEDIVREDFMEIYNANRSRYIQGE